MVNNNDSNGKAQSWTTSEGPEYQENGQLLPQREHPLALAQNRKGSRQISQRIFRRLASGLTGIPAIDTLIGGILRELQESQTSYLSYLKAHHERLSKRLDENEQEQQRWAERMERLESEVRDYIQTQQCQQSANDQVNRNSD
ncbi:MAG: hypothetical protein F6J87_18245 [Spirulina sp. SIO3F2]|nr:hypothetical protein [Spirulina sp. SIO3F2]